MSIIEVSQNQQFFSPYLTYQLTFTTKIAMTSVTFTHLLKENTPKLNSYAYYLSRNPNNSKDLFQETIAQAFEKRNQFQVGTNFGAWTKMIMRNLYLRQKTRGQLSYAQVDYLEKSDENYTCSRLYQSFELEDLSKHIDDLIPEYTVTLKLYIQGYKYEEISDLLEIPIGTVKSRIAQSRRILKTKVIN